MALAAHALGKSTSFIDGRRRNVKTLRQQLADKHSRDFAVMSTRRLRSRKRSSRVTPSPTVVTGTHRTRNQVRWGLMVHSCNHVQGGRGVVPCLTAARTIIPTTHAWRAGHSGTAGDRQSHVRESAS